jgi:hypothetical protein
MEQHNYQAADNPTDVSVTHEFASVKEAQAFVASEELKKAMQSAGVVGAQQFGSPVGPECRQVRALLTGCLGPGSVGPRVDPMQFPASAPGRG